MQTKVRYAFVDVFAEAPLTGNPVAVVPNADTLTVGQMKAIAREFNQSETTFVLRPSQPAADWRLRSYTPAGVEVGGAGHNALGAWLWLAGTGQTRGGALLRQEIDGKVSPVEIFSDPHTSTHIVMQQSAPVFGSQTADQHALATALGLTVQDFAGASAVVSTDVGHLLIPVATKAAVDAARPSSGLLGEVLNEVHGEGAYLYTTQTEERDAHAYARFFNPTVGIAEDPATGTAAGPLAARLVREGVAGDPGEVVIVQGAALGRPSRIVIHIDGTSIRISATGLITGEGVLWI